MPPSIRRLPGGVVLLLLLAAAPARAAEAVPEPAPPPPETAPPPVTEDELRKIRESLGEDASAAPPRPATVPGAQEGPIAAISGAIQSTNPDISLILDVAGAWFSEEEPLQAGGHDPRANGFNFQQLEMSVGSSVDPFFRFDTNIVFALFGVEVEEAYVTSLALPASLQLRAGQFLTRFGKINNTHPHSWHFADQPIVNGKFFGGEGNRGLGVEGSWLTPLPWYAELVASGTGAGGECCARSYYGGEDPGVNGPDDFLATTAVKQFFPFTDDLGLQWGLSAQFGPNPTGNGNRTEIYGTDLYLRFRPVESLDRTAVSLQIEALVRRRQVPDGVLEDWGSYAQLVWNIDPEWETGVRYELVSGVGDDYLDPEWTEDRHRESVQLTYFPSHFARVRLQGSRDDPGFRPTPIYAAFLTLEVIVGTHGAHTF